jgi:acyl-CoA synthetase (AMP-forming)/AMP-acid ligase II
MVSHGNLLYNSAMIHRCFETRPTEMGVIWLPLYHDMGLIGGVLQPIFAGSPVTLMSPLTFLQRPYRWLEAISRLRAAVSGGPNFAYDLCVRKISVEQRATLDLSAWSVAFSGAEPVRPETIERFTEAFAPAGFRREAWYPCYGLAEATLLVTGVQRSEPPHFCTVSAAGLEARRVSAPTEAELTRTLVGCGTSWLDQQVAIVNPETLERSAPDDVGEIWVSGPAVAGGYWRREEQSERVFRARMTGDEDGRTWLRTGDLGFLKDGELYVTGRIKDLIIIDGRNHYPQDIELSLEGAHPGLHSVTSAAFSVEIAGEEKLVVVVELDREYMPGRPAAIEPAKLAAAVRRAIAEEHAVQLHELVLIKPGYIPKTTSGKIQRHACRQGYLDGTLNRIGP